MPIFKMRQSVRFARFRPPTAQLVPTAPTPARPASARQPSPAARAPVRPTGRSFHRPGQPAPSHTLLLPLPPTLPPLTTPRGPIIQTAYTHHPQVTAHVRLTLGLILPADSSAPLPVRVPGSPARQLERGGRSEGGRGGAGAGAGTGTRVWRGYQGGVWEWESGWEWEEEDE